MSRASPRCSPCSTRRRVSCSTSSRRVKDGPEHPRRLTSDGVARVMPATKTHKRSTWVVREDLMSKGKIARLVGGAVAAVAALGLAVSAQAQEKKLKIGVVYDLTGPFAGGGSELQ